MSDKEEKADLQKWLREFRENPRKALVTACFAFVTIAVLGSVGGIQGWFGDRTKDLMTTACGWAHISVCAGPEQPGMLVFSTHVPNCLIGRIAYKFRDWTPAPNWENGADRLVVCTDASEPVTKSDLPEKLQKLVPDCLSVTRKGDNITIATALDKSAICRAPYRFDGSKLVSTSLEQGWFVCTPGYAHRLSTENFLFATKKIPACDDAILRRYGFL
jgi:hypothetical protein